MDYKQQQYQDDSSTIATSTATIIAKVVFCSSSCIEMRRFSIQDMDFIQFCALVADSLQCSSHIEDSLELRYMDVQDDDWVIFSSESEWNEAKRLYSSSESKNVMKIKVILKDDTEIKQHCSLNSRAKKRSSSRQSLSAPGCIYTKPERHQLTVCFSDFEEFSRKMREMAAESSCLSSENDNHNSSVKKTKKQSKKRSSDSSPRRKKKSSEKRKSRKTETCAQQSANFSSWGGFPNCESDWVGCSVGQPSSTIAGI